MHHPFHILESLTLLGLMILSEIVLMAQAATPNLESLIGPLMQSFGIPGAWLAVISLTLRKLILWGLPQAQVIVNTHVARQQTMAACQEKLTESTIAIQEQALAKLIAIERALPGFCHAKPPVKPPSTPPES